MKGQRVLLLSLRVEPCEKDRIVVSFMSSIKLWWLLVRSSILLAEHGSPEKTSAALGKIHQRHPSLFLLMRLRLHHPLHQHYHANCFILTQTKVESYFDWKPIYFDCQFLLLLTHNISKTPKGNQGFTGNVWGSCLPTIF